MANLYLRKIQVLESVYRTDTFLCAQFQSPTCVGCETSNCHKHRYGRKISICLVLICRLWNLELLCKLCFASSFQRSAYGKHRSPSKFTITPNRSDVLYALKRSFSPASDCLKGLGVLCISACIVAYKLEE